MNNQLTNTARKVADLLKKEYPGAKIVLNYGNTWELLVAVMLSAQTTDIQVNKVVAKLFPKYAGKDEKEEIKKFAQTPLEKLRSDVSGVGFFRNKAKNIQNSAKQILEQYDGVVPNTMEELTALPGVARKTANIVLGNAYQVYEGIAVDTHVHRIVQRLRLVDLDRIGKGKERYFKKDGKQILDFKKGANTEKIENELMQVIPQEDWFMFTYLVIEHGRTVCTAIGPKCGKCLLAKLCPAKRN